MGVVWAAGLYGENVLLHAYYRGLTVPSEAREKLTENDLRKIAENTEAHFKNSVFAWLAPISVITISSYGLWRSRRNQADAIR